MDAFNVESLLKRMATDLQALLTQRAITDYEFVGIRTGGVWLAERLQSLLHHDRPLGELDISFYRDDFSRLGLNPKVKPSYLPFDTEGKHLVVVDDVMLTGRTVRAAMNELFDFGRPNSIMLACLVDVPKRELPLQPDVRGVEVSYDPTRRIKLKGPNPMKLVWQDIT